MAVQNRSPLAWARQDIEQRMFFRGGRFTRVNTFFSVILASLLLVAFYGCLVLVNQSPFAIMFTNQGMIPYFIVFFSSWSLAILAVKYLKVRYQRKTLRWEITPSENDFVLSAATVDIVIERIYEIVDDPKHFVLFNRVVAALSNLRNLGRVSDIDEILRSQADADEAAMDTSYTLLSGFIWAIPVLGFIGTVLGLSQAIGEFGTVLQSTSEFDKMQEALQDVTGGLGTAFITTLQALVAALGVQLILVFVKKNELEFLDGCREYCQRRVVGHLRIMPYENLNMESD